MNYISKEHKSHKRVSDELCLCLFVNQRLSIYKNVRDLCDLNRLIRVQLTLELETREYRVRILNKNLIPRFQVTVLN